MNLAPDDLDRLALHLCVLMLGLFALYGLVRLVRNEWRHYRSTLGNRRKVRGAWKPGPAHHSFWNNDRRGHTECR